MEYPYLSGVTVQSHSIKDYIYSFLVNTCIPKPNSSENMASGYKHTRGLASAQMTGQ